MNKLKDCILQQVYEHFVTSIGYNGCALYNIGFDGTIEELYLCLTELIKEDKIEIITGDTGNKHIKCFDAKSIEEQVELLSTHTFRDFCIYPTQSFLKEKRDVSCFNERPFSKMLALGQPQLRCRFFNIDILQSYAIDPRYDYKFRDYCGSIYAYDTVEDSDNIYLRSFGIGRNGDDYVIAVFLRDLNLLPDVAQQKWYQKMIADSSNCKVVQNFLDNQLFGSWRFPRSVFRAIIEEIENLYNLTEHIWGTPIFSTYYNSDDEQLRDFEMLLLPTNRTLDEFYRQLEVLTVENLNKKFFELEEFGLDMFSYIKDGDYHIKKGKGTLQLLKEWLSKVKPEYVGEIHGALKLVREKRSKGGAHNLLTSQYSKKYYTEQFDISHKVFNAINLLRRIIQTHPNADDASIPYNDNTYVEI